LVVASAAATLGNRVQGEVKWLL